MFRSPHPLVVAAVVALLGLPPSVAQAQWQKNEYQMQKEHMARFEPAPLVAPRRGGSVSPAVMRVRFYADEAYRSGNARWSDRVKVQLAEMNRVLTPAFAVRLEAESFRRWDRRGPSGALGPILQELERQDAGEDVDWVVGFCAPLPILSMSFHDLGMARPLGRHFVIRGMSSLAEMQAFQEIFKALDEEDREKLYGRRKTHKEMSVFLHEWAHSLGLPHVEDPTRIMSPGYSQRTSEFSLEDAHLLSAALTGRLDSRGRAQSATDWSVLRQHLLSVRNPPWQPREVAELKAQLESLSANPAAQRSATGPGGDGAAVPVPPPPGLMGRPKVTPPPAPPPPPPGSAAASPSSDRTTGGRTTARPTPATVGARGLFENVRALTVEGKRAEAVSLIEKAEQGATGDNAARGATLADLARLYAESGVFSAAARALGKSGELGSEAAPAAAEDVKRMRRYYGIPEGAPTVTPETEILHADIIDKVRSALRAERLKEAQTAITAGLEQLARAPALLTLACEIELRQGRARAAIPRCKQALAVAEENPRAHYILGCAQAEAGQAEPALKSLKRAITLDPADQSAWRSLGDLYRMLGRSREFTKFVADKAGPAGAPAAQAE